MAGEVDLLDQRARERVQIGLRGEAEVARRDEDVVHVEQQPAPGAAGERLEEVDLVPLVAVDGKVVRRVLDRDRPAERVLHAADVVGDAGERLVGARERQQVGVIRATPRRPREVLGDERGSMRSTSAPSRRRWSAIGPLRGSQRERDAVQRDRMPGADRLEPREPRPALDQVVLGMDLEPQPVRRARRAPRRSAAASGPARRTVPWSRVQLLTGVSEPMPFGVFIVVQVPFATYFQALPW